MPPQPMLSVRLQSPENMLPSTPTLSGVIASLHRFCVKCSNNRITQNRLLISPSHLLTRAHARVLVCMCVCLYVFPRSTLKWKWIGLRGEGGRGERRDQVGKHKSKNTGAAAGTKVQILTQILAAQVSTIGPRLHFRTFERFSGSSRGK